MAETEKSQSSQLFSFVIFRADKEDLRSIAALQARKAEALSTSSARSADRSRQGLHLRELDKFVSGTASFFATVKSSEALNVEDLQECSNLKDMLDARFMKLESFEQSVQSLKEKYSGVAIRKTVGAVDVDDVREATESILQHALLPLTNSCYISNLLVDSKYRRCGIGSRLLSAVARHACEKGLGGMVLSVEEHNQIAIRLYEKQGSQKSTMLLSTACCAGGLQASFD